MDKDSNWNIADSQEWPFEISKPFLISGPCSAESKEQLFQTAEGLKKTGAVHLLRAGLWKPRTRPGSFEGVGEKGLEWLIEAGKKFDLPTTTEVATPRHVDLCLKAGVDVLWIGARTTVNPFSVQGIADALKGVDIPVIVKNPINPDLQLWLGAIERINRAGIDKIMAMHRGFSDYGEKHYRNAPMWEIPIALRTILPNLPIINDPSHICGRRDILFDVAQKALNLGMEGLMIESHINPDVALSDAAQQITPVQYGDMISKLSVRSSDASSKGDLSILRKQIDEIDQQIIDLFKKRMDVARNIGEYKKDHDMLVLQLERWKEIVATRSVWANENDLSEEFILKYLEQLHKESIRIQASLMTDSDFENEVMW